MNALDSASIARTTNTSAAGNATPDVVSTLAGSRPPALPQSLTGPELSQLKDCERTINAGLATFLDVAHALLTIKAKHLYRGDYPTFEAYCRYRWDISRAYAYRLTGAAEVFERLLAITDVSPPRNERQLRKLVGLDPRLAAKAWRKAHVLAGEAEPTSRHVADALSQLHRSTRGRDQGGHSNTDEPESYVGGALHETQRLRKCLLDGNVEEALVVLAKLRLFLERAVGVDSPAIDQEQIGSDESHSGVNR